MPFAGYEDFEDCVAQNGDKADPEAYCAAIERAVLDLDAAVASNVPSTAALRSGTMRFQIVPTFDPPAEFADLDGDGVDDVTGQPIEPAEAPMIEADGPGSDFRALLVVEGVWTGDGRWIEEGALGWRELPLPLMATDRTTEGHLDAILIGTFDRIEREGREVYGVGTFVESDDPEVRRLQNLINQGALRGISVDLDAVEYEVVIPAADVDDAADLGYGKNKRRMDGDGNEVVQMDAYKMRILSARIMGATAVPFPAFAEAFIESLANLTAALDADPRVTGHIARLRSYDDIDFVAPEGARTEAQRGLDWREEFGRGGTAVGVARARDIVNRKALSPDTIGRMVSFFARHEVDKQGQGFSPGEDGYPSAGRIAWALWGGDAGRAWAEKISRQMSLRDEAGSMTAGGYPVEAPLLPPSAWFDDPGLNGPTSLTVTNEGRIYGHLALWGQCHVGFDTCVTPPRSAAAYGHFTTGELITADGDRRPVGQITMDTGHAPLAAKAAGAAAHYDHTGTAVADCAAGEDAHGIWLAGALRPGVAPEQIRALMAADVSGDWRRVGSALELVAVLAVNVPGFGKARVRQDEGLVASLIAAAPTPAPADPVALRKAADRVAATIGRSLDQRRAEVAARVRAG